MKLHTIKINRPAGGQGLTKLSIYSRLNERIEWREELLNYMEIFTVRESGLSVILMSLFQASPIRIEFDFDGTKVYTFKREDVGDVYYHYQRSLLPEGSSEAERVYDFLLKHASTVEQSHESLQ